MGAGRRTHTYTLQEKSQQTYSINGSVTARNLRSADLGGVIFGCKHKTMRECFAKKLFGLPTPHFSYVKNVKPGLPLFLFNYSDRKLHGIFEAASHGKLNIDPHGWTELGSPTPYGAQVKIQIKFPCQPLLEDQFGPIIAGNYFDSGLFWFELDHEQTRKLISLLSSSPVSVGNFLSRKTEMSGFSRASSSNARQESSVATKNPLSSDTAHQTHAKMVSDASTSCMGWKSMETPSLNPNLDAVHVNQSKGLSYSSVVKKVSSSKSTFEEEETGIQEVVHPKSNNNQSCSSAGGNDTSLPQKTWSSLFGTDNTTSPGSKTGTEDTSFVGSKTGTENTSFVGSKTGAENTTSIGRKFEILKWPASEAHVTSSDCTFKSWDSDYVFPQTGKEILVDSKASVDVVPCEEKIINSEPNYVLVDSNAATMSTFVPQDTISGMARQDIGHVSEESFEAKSAFPDGYMDLIHSCVQPYLDGQSDSSGSPTAELAVQVSEIEILCSEEKSNQRKNMYYRVGSFDTQSVVAKLLQELEELKFSKQQYIHRINCLEQDLAKSRLEFQQLKDQFELSKMGHTAEAASQSSYECRPDADEWVFVVGGYNGSSWLVDLDLYSSCKDLLKPLCPMSSVRSYCSAAMLNGDLYVFGGVSGQTWYDVVESYNPLTNQWVSRPALNQKNGSLAGVSLNEKILAIGGGNGVDCFSEVEMFDQHLGKWIYSQPMHHKRFSPAAANFDGVIYVSGGFDGKDYLKSMERFDPRERSWVNVASMSTKRACHSVAVLGKKLYALGGYDGSKMVPTVEVYDPYMNRWMMGEPMKNRRGHFSSVVIKNAIYAIGGLIGNDVVLDEVECYKEGLGWQVADMECIGKRAFFTAIKL